uniref:Phenylalanine-tRNA ligase beta subunit n=1 Tax=Pterosiphonia complanata TaxID=884089 RepID=UPI0022FD4909|nr:Phenylalanine-tRNA ligase beta subunit [Pterosiphonia complanata]WAX03183.1 Phenylalanine-tRNA ligase beta subunit [Pterosiphonia complanata]
MKFSLQTINHFINLNKIKFHEFEENLTLSGLEIDSLETIDKYKDKIIDINITANREEICSSLSLAIETSTIFNIPVTILPIKLNYKNSVEHNTNKLIKTRYTHIVHTRIVTLEKMFTKQTPDWILNQLKINRIEYSETLNNIKEYIRIKWGQTFHIISNKEMYQNNNIIKYSNLIELFNSRITKTINSKSKILIFTTINKKENTKFFNNESNEFYENAFIDSIKLINTFIGAKIGKYHEAYQRIIVENNIITIRKKKIDESLGYIKGKKLKYIKTNKIESILQQLKLLPKYNKKDKSFKVIIPNYRKNDLTREIDIIEEIGRIYQFKHFFNNITTHNLQGYKSKNFIQIKQIRNALSKLGLNEVINCCITKNIPNNINNPKIYNPITYEQQDLRTNILENLLNNYKQNINNSKNNIEIFEIGKVFEINNNNTKVYQEKRHLSGLISNQNYTRNSWRNQSSSITLFHFKNIIETFLETINSEATIQEILRNNKKVHVNFAEYLFKKTKKMGIYNPKNKNIIGIIGELNNKFINKDETIYIFEINLNQLIATTQSKNHLKYTSKQYSNYPSVTRDISIKLQKYIHIEKIKKNIVNENNKLIESLEILNEYKNNNKSRYVSIRITYRSKIRTLNSQDIKEIDTNLENKIKELQQT